VGLPGHTERVRQACASWLVGYVPTGPLIVACSGGADSLALTLGVLAASGGRPVIGATVDHGLQSGSEDRARANADLLRRLGCADVRVLAVSVEGTGGLEAAARRARYAALSALSVELGGAPVLLGHTVDDQAETVLLGLARGSGPRSIAGMRPWRSPWGRPLLTLTRANTEAVCLEAGLEPWRDPHNDDSAFTRVRLRREVLPLLEEVLGGGVSRALARTGELMAADLEALDSISADALARAVEADGSLRIDDLVDWPSAVRRRVLRLWLAGCGGGALTHDHLTRLDRQLTDPRGPVQVRVPGGLDVWRRGARLVMMR
jgi:tRNA(Ile)-lysidine synthase